MAVQPFKFLYFPIRARIVLPLAAAIKGNLPYELASPNWPADKSKTLFGQLPHMEHGDLKMGQSLAIARYVGRKAGLLGESDKEFAVSEMLVQQMEDIYMELGKSQHSGDKTAAFKAALETGIPQKLSCLEKMLSDTTFTGKILLGDLAIFSILYIIVTDVKPDILEAYPKLKSFYAHVHADEALKPLFAAPLHRYFNPSE